MVGAPQGMIMNQEESSYFESIIKQFLIISYPLDTKRFKDSSAHNISIGGFRGKKEKCKE
eukprot:10042894-Ditylum_brightwellii.AAC.1